MTDAIIRICCAQPHTGPACPDGRVMCVWCGGLREQWDLYVEPDGTVGDTCRDCDSHAVANGAPDA